MSTDERDDEAGEGRSTWTGRGRVRARSTAQGLEVAIDGLTTQAKYYKPLVYEFFRKEWRGARASYGDFCVEITMFYTGDPPWLDLDNAREPATRRGRLTQPTSSGTDRGRRSSAFQRLRRTLRRLSRWGLRAAGT